MRFLKIVAAVAAASACVVLSATPAFAADCKFVKLGELKVNSDRGPPLVDIEVNGKKGKLLVDTGAFASYLTTAGAAALGVKPGEALSNMRIVGSNGEIHATYQTIPNAVIGGAFQLSRFGVLIMPGGSDGEIVGSLGLDVLAASDIEFDLANGRIAMFSAKDCGKLPLAYWGNNYVEAPTRRPSADRPHIVTTVQLNGHDFPTRISTGNSYSAVEKVAAAVAGVTPDSPGVQALNPQAYQGRGAWIGTFGTFAIGDEQIKNVKLTFADLFGGMRLNQTGTQVRQKIDDLPSVVLGLDFLRSHRVLVANSQGRMYFTYNGGPVFARPTAP